MESTTLTDITVVKKLKYRHNHDGIKHMINRVNFLNAKGEYQDGRTEQCHKDECDINQVIKKYDKHGIITHINKAVAHYGDYSEVNEYQDALNVVLSSDRAFMALPSEIRTKHGNDAGTFLEYASNPANMDEMVKDGLAIAPTVQDTSPIEVVIKEAAKEE